MPLSACRHTLRPDRRLALHLFSGLCAQGATKNHPDAGLISLRAIDPFVGALFGITSTSFTMTLREGPRGIFGANVSSREVVL